MPRPFLAAPSLGRRYLAQVVLPLVAILVVVTAAGAIAVHWAAQRSNASSARQEERVLQVAIADTVSHLGVQQRSVAEWPPLAAHLREPVLDLAWFDENLGNWLYTMFGHDQVYVLGPDGEPVYAAIGGERRPPGEFAPVQAAIAPWLAELAAAAPDAAPIRGGVLALDGRPAAVSVSRVQEAPGAPSPYFLVSAMLIDQPYLDALSEHSIVEDLRLLPAGAPAQGLERLPLASATGERLGDLAWTPDRPGTAMLRLILPVGLFVLACVLAIVAFMARQLWVSSRRLEEGLIELRAQEAQAQHLAFHDVLTGLPNRALLDDRLAQALARAERHGARVALLMMDLDRFKQVNDTLGHQAGDVLIREVARRLAGVVRETDTVARVGGDEFVVVQTGITQDADIDALCRRVLDAVSRPVRLFGSDVMPDASIGVAVAADHGLDRGELMRKADIALYAAKSEGRGRYRRFAQPMDDTLRMRSGLAHELRTALAEQRDLAVRFQPQVDPEGRIVGVEALVRWQHPQRGPILPDEFIPIAEETGLIAQLGEWVLREACRMARRVPELYVAVNLSPAQFRTRDLAEHLIDIVRAEHCDPARIQLEITEGVLLVDNQGTRDTLEALRAAGFTIALDDFGTGYSSLSYLRHFPVDKIKIDRSFTQHLAGDANAPAIIDSVVGLGRALGLTVSAEGVETQEQMNALVAAGCDELQGYLFARPLPPGEVEQLVREAAGRGGGTLGQPRAE